MPSVDRNSSNYVAATSLYMLAASLAVPFPGYRTGAGAA